MRWTRAFNGPHGASTAHRSYSAKTTRRRHPVPLLESAAIAPHPPTHPPSGERNASESPSRRRGPVARDKHRTEVFRVRMAAQEEHDELSQTSEHIHRFSAYHGTTKGTRASPSLQAKNHVDCEGGGMIPVALRNCKLFSADSDEKRRQPSNPCSCDAESAHDIPEKCSRRIEDTRGKRRYLENRITYMESIEILVSGSSTLRLSTPLSVLRDLT